MPTTPIPLLQTRLITHKYFCNLFGFEDLGGFRDNLQDKKEGYTEVGLSYFVESLSALEKLKISVVSLRAYDLRIKGYMERLNRNRISPVRLKYFQYVAVLFTEIFLDRALNDEARFLQELNGFVTSMNAQELTAAKKYLPFSSGDLRKLGFWMATGSGKTLILHLNYGQFLFYRKHSEINDVLLITPNEGLSRQHLRELELSGIRAHRFGTTINGSNGTEEPAITVIEITKLADSKRGGGLRVEVESFGAKNLVFVDEAHRGTTGEVWKELRGKLANNGFAFEYSATLGQTVNGASQTKRKALLQEYSKSILFDYSYPHFYEDGYGKDYWVTNVKSSKGDYTDWILTANLLSFYEQLWMYEQHRSEVQEHNLEKPLWVFVGHSVTATSSSAKDKASLTDVQQIVSFVDAFLRDRATSETRIKDLLEGHSGILGPDDKSDAFATMFRHIRSAAMTPAQIYTDALKRIFHCSPGDHIRALELTSAPGEVGLRVGDHNPMFGVINIGNAPKLMRLFEKPEVSIPAAKDTFAPSLFDRISAPESDITVLIGSKKFSEGWDSYRVSSMGLMNIGVGEGSQVIQLFGRGVRLKGKASSLKRTSALSDLKVPDFFRTLETLTVFGIRANYMTQFRQNMKQEGVDIDFEDISIPLHVRDEYLKRDLRILEGPLVQFLSETGLVLSVDPDIKVDLDLRTRADTLASEVVAENSSGEHAEDVSNVLRSASDLLDWDTLYSDLNEFAWEKGLTNIAFTKQSLRDVINSGKLEIIAPPKHFRLAHPQDLDQLCQLAASILRKYFALFYERHRAGWEKDRMRVTALSKTHANLSFVYQARVKQSAAAGINADLASNAVYDGTSKELPKVHFDRHIYEPLLLEPGSAVNRLSPVGLDTNEAKFVNLLHAFLGKYSDKLNGTDVFLLRNLTRGKGIFFFDNREGESFYPDFVLWVLKEKTQNIIFIDPHGLRYTSYGFEDAKVRLHRDLKTLEPILQKQVPNWKLVLDSFILSTTKFENAQRAFGTERPTKSVFADNHIIFLEDGEVAIVQMMAKIGAVNLTDLAVSLS